MNDLISFQMMQEGESREQGHNNKDMDDLLELLTDSGGIGDNFDT